MIDLLAEAVPAVDGAVSISAVLGWVTSFVVAVIGAVLAKQAKTQGRQEGKAELLTLGPQPFMVTLQEEFVRRTEFREFKTEMSLDIKEATVLLRELGKEVNAKHLELIEALQSSAAVDREGRVALWNAFRPVAEKVTALAATSDVANQLGKLAEAIASKNLPPPRGNAK